MVTNFYFQNFEFDTEQRLFEDLVVEFIQFYGQDMYYIPRVINNKDELFGADDISTYEKAYLIETYIRSIEGFGGDGNFLSKAGFEIRNTIIFTIAKRRFEDEIGYPENQPRPREGDLVYFPLNDKCFQVMYVDNKSTFYQFGELQTYDLHCELFEYSNERFSTGIPRIDSIMGLSTNVFDYNIVDESGNRLVTEDGHYVVTEKFNIEVIEPISDNQTIQDKFDEFADFSELDPFSKSGRY